MLLAAWVWLGGIGHLVLCDCGKLTRRLRLIHDVKASNNPVAVVFPLWLIGLDPSVEVGAKLHSRPGDVVP